MNDEPSVLCGCSQSLIVGHEGAQFSPKHHSGRQMYGVQGSQLARIQLRGAIEHRLIERNQPHRAK
jgi:hypothetical protein